MPSRRLGARSHSRADPGLWAGTTAGRCCCCRRCCCCAGRHYRRGPAYSCCRCSATRPGCHRRSTGLATPDPPGGARPRGPRARGVRARGRAVQRRHRAADKQRRRCWYRFCRWRLLLSLSSSAGSARRRRRRRPSTTRCSCSTTCSFSSQKSRSGRCCGPLKRSTAAQSPGATSSSSRAPRPLRAWGPPP